MRKCYNCKKELKDDYIYCPNCGYKYITPTYYVIIDILIFIISIAILILIGLFIASFFCK